MKKKRLYKLEEIVKEILEEDKLAREDDGYLIFLVVQRIEPNLAGTTFKNVMLNGKTKGISFESITRVRRKVQKENPELINEECEEKREEEMKEYIEFSKNV